MPGALPEPARSVLLKRTQKLSTVEAEEPPGSVCCKWTAAQPGS
jgi:hypothetical protein